MPFWRKVLIGSLHTNLSIIDKHVSCTIQMIKFQVRHPPHQYMSSSMLRGLHQCGSNIPCGTYSAPKGVQIIDFAEVFHMFPCQFHCNQSFQLFLEVQILPRVRYNQAVKENLSVPLLTMPLDLSCAHISSCSPPGFFLADPSVFTPASKYKITKACNLKCLYSHSYLVCEYISMFPFLLH